MKKQSQLRKANTGVFTTTPNQLSEEELKSLQCHFNWGIHAEELTKTSLQERIRAVEGHIRENSEGRNLPQSYTLLGYLKYFSEDLNIRKEAIDNFEEADKSLRDSESTSINVDNKKRSGYYAVVYANLTYLYSKTNLHKESMEYFEKYNNIAGESSIKIEEHPELLATKAFAFGYLTGHERTLQSIELYKMALSHVDYKDTVEWLFGLAFSKINVAYGREKACEDCQDIENILRKTIFLDPNYAYAMLKLAKQIHKTNGNRIFAKEEVEYWIEKALMVDRKTSILEESATIYRFMAHGNSNSEYEIKAMELFKEANEKTPTSKKANKGLAVGYQNIYFSKTKGKIRNTHTSKVPESLEMAEYYFKCNEDNLTHFERHQIASLYQEMSRYKNCKDYLEKAEDIFKDVIRNTEEENDVGRRIEAFSKYAEFLRKQKRFDEEIEMLKKAVSIPSNDHGKEVMTEMQCMIKCEDKLLEYASSNKNITKLEAYKLKSWIQSKRGNVHTAIFYLEEALKLCEDDVSIFKRDFASLYLQASEIKHERYTHDESSRFLVKAKEIIDEMEESQAKNELFYRVMQKEVKSLMENDDELRELKRVRMVFEHDNKNRKPNANSAINQIENIPDEIQKVLHIIGESKRVLDRAINDFKLQVYSKHHHQKPLCYFRQFNQNTVKQMEDLLQKRYGFTDFSKNFPELFHFLVGGVSGGNASFKELQICIDIRNATEHSTEYKDCLISNFPDATSRANLVRSLSDYAAKVWRKFQEEIIKHKKNVK